MGKLGTPLRNQRGETLVELMVSIVIFLLLLGTMAGAISFASNAQQKAQTIRDNAAALQYRVRHTDPAETGTIKTLSLYVTDAEESAMGTNPVCRVNVNEQTIPAQGTNGNTTSFSVFGTDKTPAPGGGGSGG